jgi:hypothetical protein
VRIIKGDEKGTRHLEVLLDRPAKIERYDPPGLGLDTRLTTLLCKEINIVAKSENEN